MSGFSSRTCIIIPFIYAAPKTVLFKYRDVGTGLAAAGSKFALSIKIETHNSKVLTVCKVLNCNLLFLYYTTYCSFWQNKVTMAL